MSLENDLTIMHHLEVAKFGRLLSKKWRVP